MIFVINDELDHAVVKIQGLIEQCDLHTRLLASRAELGPSGPKQKLSHGARLRHDDEPAIEDLLEDRFEISPRLALGHALSRITYLGQLSQGVGAAVPPQVTSTAAKPLSIAFEEISAERSYPSRSIPRPRLQLLRSLLPKLKPPPNSATSPPDRGHGDHARRPPHRPRCHRRHRRLQGCRGLSPTRRRRCRWPRPHRGAQRMVGATTFSALASEPVRTELWDDPETPIPHTRWGRPPISSSMSGDGRLISDLRTGRSADLLMATILASGRPS